MYDFGPLFHTAHSHQGDHVTRTGVECPECCESSGVHRTIRHDAWTERVRVCTAEAPHVFRTREGLLRGVTLKCRSCWTDNTVVQTENFGGYMRRTRLCKVCRHVFKTKEAVVR